MPPSTAERLQQPLNKPRLAVRPIFERREKDQDTQRHDRKRLAFNEIFDRPNTAPFTGRRVFRHTIAVVAASVAVVTVLWFGAHVGKFGKDLLDLGTAQMSAFLHIGSGAAGVGETSSTSALPVRPEPSAFQDPVAWVRGAAAKRATTHLAESFDRGMAAWGVKSKGWAPGWAWSPDGYVRPGQLALLQPTIQYADYRMDFFGQIENNGMSWVVRGKDTQNYYAMKVRILRPGLRPVVSMTHYPVVRGQQGHRVDLPLSVMIHNGKPYHVSVEVKGSHYTTSIEGEQVDSWSDDTLLVGGVGFFSEAGQRARIYWVKVSRNDDWLGWWCRQIGGTGEVADTVRLEHPVPSLLPAFVMTSMYPTERLN